MQFCLSAATRSRICFRGRFVVAAVSVVAVVVIVAAATAIRQAYLMAAVLTGGVEGRDQCRTRLDAMVEMDGGMIQVHEKLLEQVYKLLGRE